MFGCNTLDEISGWRCAISIEWLFYDCHDDLLVYVGDSDLLELRL